MGHQGLHKVSMELRVIDVEYNLSFGSVDVQSTELCGNVKLNDSCSSMSTSVSGMGHL